MVFSLSFDRRKSDKAEYSGCSVHENNNGQATFENPMYNTNSKSIEGKVVRFDPNLNTVCTMVLRVWCCQNCHFCVGILLGLVSSKQLSSTVWGAYSHGSSKLCADLQENVTFFTLRVENYILSTSHSESVDFVFKRKQKQKVMCPFSMWVSYGANYFKPFQGRSYIQRFAAWKSWETLNFMQVNMILWLPIGVKTFDVIMWSVSCQILSTKWWS